MIVCILFKLLAEIGNGFVNRMTSAAGNSSLLLLSIFSYRTLNKNIIIISYNLLSPSLNNLIYNYISIHYIFLAFQCMILHEKFI